MVRAGVSLPALMQLMGHAHIREAMAKVWGGHSFEHSNQKSDPKATSDLSVTDFIDKDLAGATRRDRTGDLLITKNIRRLQTLH